MTELRLLWREIRRLCRHPFLAALYVLVMHGHWLLIVSVGLQLLALDTGFSSAAHAILWSLINLMVAAFGVGNTLGGAGISRRALLEREAGEFALGGVLDYEPLHPRARARRISRPVRRTAPPSICGCSSETTSTRSQSSRSCRIRRADRATRGTKEEPQAAPEKASPRRSPIRAW